MRVKRKLNVEIVEHIKGHTSLELIERCPDQRRVFPSAPCKNRGCEFAIREPGYMNCTFVAAEAGGHTLEAVGKMMGITREGVRLIEVRAMKTFRERWKASSTNGTVHQQLHPPGSGHVRAETGRPELEDEDDLLSARHGGELDERAG